MHKACIEVLSFLLFCVRALALVLLEIHCNLLMEFLANFMPTTEISNLSLINPATRDISPGKFSRMNISVLRLEIRIFCSET